LVYKNKDITSVVLLSLSIGMGMAGLYVEKVTDGNLRKYDECESGLYTGYTLQLTAIVTTSIILNILVS
jgi:hypothetical protein